MEEQIVVEGNQPNPEGFFADTNNQAACSVRVALRVRPLISREQYEKMIVRSFSDTSTVQIGPEKMFTFDATFDQESQQEAVFNTCVRNLVLGCFHGFNATVLAYGQTGSGKTWTMGSGYTSNLDPDEFGIIPRVINLIFDEVDKKKSKIAFVIKCSFLEIYNEELNDLLDSNSLHLSPENRNSKINIREEKNGQIAIYGLKEEQVHNSQEMGELLERGSNFRTTASTLMNNSSSRSHAIFTISIEQRQIVETEPHVEVEDQQVGSGGEANPTSDEFMVAKFHFVDLAGSERAKKTGAQGATLKEGININKSLLVLGNVISALSEEGKKGNFVPYRDSKLTRILQDSLGGNSRTTMIACCSPAESNFDETLNTLNYASRARKIKNKPKVNRDPNSALIAELRHQIYEFQKECLRFRKILVNNEIEFKPQIELPTEEELQSIEASQVNTGPMIKSSQQEFGMSGKEIRALEDQIQALKIENSKQSKENQGLRVSEEELRQQLAEQKIENFENLTLKDQMRTQLDQVNMIMDAFGCKEQIYGELQRQLRQRSIEDGTEQEQQSSSLERPDLPMIIGLDQSLVQEYAQQNQQLKRDLNEQKLMIKQMQHNTDMLTKQTEEDQTVLTNQSQTIEKYKQSNAKLQKENIQVQADLRNASQKKNFNVPARLGKTKTGSNFNHTGGLHKEQEDFAHSFKKSFHMNSKVAEIQNRASGNWLGDVEEKMKQFNDKFMENLTISLTQQLGIDLLNTKQEAELFRKQNKGQSFVESNPQNSLLASDPKQGSTPSLNAFGPLQSFGKSQRNNFSSSVIVPDLQMNNQRLTQNSEELGNKKNMASPRKGPAMSIIQDDGTINEQDSIQEENIDTSEEGSHTGAPQVIEKYEDENVRDDKPKLELNKSVLSNIDLDSIKKSIAQRASLLQAEEIRKSLMIQNDEEMKNEQDFGEVDVQECSEDEEELQDEMRDIGDNELFDHIEKVEKNNLEQNSVLIKFDGEIKDKESLLQSVKETQAAMQKELLDLMKNQYQHKVLELTNEITLLEKEKFTHLKQGYSDVEKQKIGENFKQKQRELEKELRDAKEKNKQQLNIKKQLDMQNSKIKGLESEIQKIKIQKTSAQRKFKEQSDKYNVLRKQRADEVLKMKKQALKKDKEIDQLKKEAKRKELINKRRGDEIKVLQTQKKMVVSKKANATKVKQQSQQIDTNQIKDWIRESLNKMIEIRDAELELQTQNQKLEEVNSEIESESNHKASLCLLKEKLLVKKYMMEGQPEKDQDMEDLFKIDNELRKLDQEIEQYQSNIVSLQETEDYLNAKLSEISKEMLEIQMEFGNSLGNQNLQSAEGIKAVVDCFFSILKEASEQLRKLKMDHEKKVCEFDELKDEHLQQQNILEANEKYFQAKMQNIENEFHLKEEQLNQLMEEAKNDIEENRAGSTNQPKSIHQRILTAKEEVQMHKDAAINESKMFLSKRVSELERINQEQEKANQNIQNKLNQALSEKQYLIQQVSQLKNQLKMTNEVTNDINLRSHIQQQYAIGQGQTQGPQRNKATSLADKRIELKNLKQVKKGGIGILEMAEPRVFEIEDDENEDLDENKELVETLNLRAYSSMSTLQNSGMKKKLKINPDLAEYKADNNKPQQPVYSTKNQRNKGGVFDRLTQNAQKKTGVLGSMFRRLGTSKNSESALNIPVGALKIRQGSTINSQRANRSMSRAAEPKEDNQQEENPYGTLQQAITQNHLFNQHKEEWSVQSIIDQAHKDQIYDIESVGNMLYSTSMRNLKIWDLNTMQMISDIKAHTGIIKQVKAMPLNSQGDFIGQQIFVTAGDKNDKTVQIWDMTTLKCEAVLKGHKGDIRALEFGKDGKHIFSAGQGGLFVWDLRNLESPIELIERHMDIFSLKATKSQLFMGCRNHSIIPMGLSSSELFIDQVQAPLLSPHLDVVTSFTSILDDEILISASKDKNLRGWATQQEMSQKPLVALQNLNMNQAHNDHINVVSSSFDQQRMFSGSKDGVLNVWKAVGDFSDLETVQLVNVDSLQGQGSPVTAITCLDPQFGDTVIYASMDKSLRVCKRQEIEFQEDNYGAFLNEANIDESKQLVRSAKKR